MSQLYTFAEFFPNQISSHISLMSSDCRLTWSISLKFLIFERSAFQSVEGEQNMRRGHEPFFINFLATDLVWLLITVSQSLDVVVDIRSVQSKKKWMARTRETERQNNRHRGRAQLKSRVLIVPGVSPRNWRSGDARPSTIYSELVQSCEMWVGVRCELVWGVWASVVGFSQYRQLPPELRLIYIHD